MFFPLRILSIHPSPNFAESFQVGRTRRASRFDESSRHPSWSHGDTNAKRECHVCFSRLTAAPSAARRTRADAAVRVARAAVAVAAPPLLISDRHLCLLGDNERYTASPDPDIGPQTNYSLVFLTGITFLSLPANIYRSTSPPRSCITRLKTTVLCFISLFLYLSRWRYLFCFALASLFCLLPRLSWARLGTLDIVGFASFSASGNDLQVRRHSLK